MNKTFYEKALRTIRRFSMLQGHEKIIVAVSGGPDSTALLTFLAALRKKLSLRLFCIHVNHGLRGSESDEDARLVAEYAAFCDIPVRILNCSAAAYASRHHISIEHAGRTLRYSLLKKHARELGATRVATAHHLDDQAEDGVDENHSRNRSLRYLWNTSCKGRAFYQAIHRSNPAGRSWPMLKTITSPTGPTQQMSSVLISETACAQQAHALDDGV